MGIQGIPYLNLTGPDLEPLESNNLVLKLFGFPRTWSGKDIYELFRTYGRIQIKWIDDTSCLITMCDELRGLPVMANLVIPNVPEVSGFSLSVYSKTDVVGPASSNTGLTPTVGNTGITPTVASKSSVALEKAAVAVP